MGVSVESYIPVILNKYLESNPVKMMKSILFVFVLGVMSGIVHGQSLHEDVEITQMMDRFVEFNKFDQVKNSFINIEHRHVAAKTSGQ